MRLRHRLITPFTTVVLFAAPITLGACAGHGTSYRLYDPYYSDYHRWNRAEDGFYRRWEVGTQRPHVDFRRRTAEEQRTYFTWRHGR
jgi:hypothetical protein